MKPGEILDTLEEGGETESVLGKKVFQRTLFGVKEPKEKLGVFNWWGNSLEC